MPSALERFDFEYGKTDVTFGRGVVDELGTQLREHGFKDALVVCGRNVGTNDALMDRVRAGLGDRLAGMFDETTPEKRIETVFDGIEARRAAGADALVGLGGGSSLDVARQISAFEEDGRSLSEIRDAARAGTLDAIGSNGPQTAVATVPTTFAGADISSGGSMEILPASETSGSYPVRISGSTEPMLTLFDPECYETTPIGALAGSAMNGFNKGIETQYARNGNPVTDATAAHGLRHLRAGFQGLESGDPAAMDRAVVGMILVQYERKTSIIHAVGHGFSRRYPLQQGVVHAIVLPHVLRHLFEEVDASREALAEGLGIDADGMDDEELADAIVDAVTDVRDAFELPTRLRDVDSIQREDFPDVAEFILADSNMERAPADLEATPAWIEAILEDAW